MWEVVVAHHVDHTWITRGKSTSKDSKRTFLEQGAHCWVCAWNKNKCTGVKNLKIRLGTWNFTRWESFYLTSFTQTHLDGTLMHAADANIKH
jgi:hypothetical protein